MVEKITFDGFDGTRLAVPVINVWKEYDNRAAGLATQVKHGASGYLVRRDGDACLVQVDKPNGQTRRGWATFYFIRELKADWLADRIAVEQRESLDRLPFTLQNGRTIHIVKAPMPGVRAFVPDLGGWETINDPARLAALEGTARERATDAYNGLFNFLCGWGVAELPGTEDVAGLHRLGLDAAHENIQRANWMRTMMLSNDDEAGVFFWTAVYFALGLYAVGVSDGGN